MTGIQVTLPTGCADCTRWCLCQLCPELDVLRAQAEETARTTGDSVAIVIKQPQVARRNGRMDN